ncbi:MAG TPA: hypothetical protein VF602_05435, partial [Pedobacter sp.]
MKIFFLFIALTSFTTSYAQNDHLEPADKPSDYSGISKDYYSGIFKLLESDLNDCPIARYTVLPSFSPEYILSVEKHEGKKFKIVYQSSSENYWYSKNRPGVRLNNASRPIDKAFVIKIKSLFEAVIRETKEIQSNPVRTDGVTSISVGA